MKFNDSVAEVITQHLQGRKEHPISMIAALVNFTTILIQCLKTSEAHKIKIAEDCCGVIKETIQSNPNPIQRTLN